MAKRAMSLVAMAALALACFTGAARAQGSILEVAQSSPDFSTLVAAVLAADVPELVDAISSPDTVATLFAPTNEAFAKLAADLGISEATLLGLPPSTLASVILYHVVPGAAAFSTDLTDGQVLPTLNPEGAELLVDLADGVEIMGVGSDAQVIGPDVGAGAAVVHVIDTVLLPFEVGAAEPAPEPEAECPSIAEVASSVPDLSILVDAVVAAGLVDALSNGEDVLTVFAPTNDAFVALLGALGLESLEDVPIDALTTVLLYHVVPGVAAYSTDLTDGQVITTLEGSDLTVDLALDISTGSVGVEILGVGSDATVIIADVPACNSVVHVIDAVLLPFELPGGDEPVEEDDDDDARLPGGPPASGPGGRFCLPRKAPCAFNFQCCSGRCRGPSLIFPFYRKCTLF